MGAVAGSTVTQGDGLVMRMHARRLACTFALLTVVSGCAAEQPAPATQGPTRALVTWADSMCEHSATLRDRQASFARLPGDASSTDPFAETDVDNYLTVAGMDAQRLTQAFRSQPRSGIAEADALVDDYARLLSGISPEITNLTGEPGATTSFGLPEKLVRARRVGQLFNTVKPDGPGLPELVAKHPALKAAYDVAPRCEPSGPSGAAPRSPDSAVPSAAPNSDAPLPPAEDGTDVTACRAGRCQISVSGSVDLPTDGLTLRVTVEEGMVTVGHTDSSGSRSMSQIGSVGSTAIIGSGDRQVTVVLDGIKDNTAVLTISAR